MSARISVALSLALASAAMASAHDFWIEASPSWAQLGDEVKVGLRVGHFSGGEALGRDPRHLLRLEAWHSGVARPIEGRNGHDPAGNWTPDSPGLYVVAFQSRPSTLAMDAEGFEQYLAEEGLAEAQRLRAERGHQGRPGLERFQRCAKSLVQVGDSAHAGFDQVVGLPLELIPLLDPLELREGGALPVRVVFRDAPVEGVLVHAVRKPDDRSVDEACVASARSDANGHLQLELDRGGDWLIHAVHMVPADEGPAEWESFWASLTFSAPSRAGETDPPSRSDR